MGVSVKFLLGYGSSDHRPRLLAELLGIAFRRCAGCGGSSCCVSPARERLPCRLTIAQKKPLPRRRHKAREQGQIARSRDLTSSLTLLAVIFRLSWLATSFPGQWLGLLHDSLDTAVQSDLSTTNQLFASTSMALLRWTAPCDAGGLGGFDLRHGGARRARYFPPRRLHPNWARLNPGHQPQEYFFAGGREPHAEDASAVRRSSSTCWSDFSLAAGLRSRSLHLGHSGDADALAFSLIFEVAWKSTLVMLAVVRLRLLPAAAQLRTLAAHDQGGSAPGSERQRRESAGTQPHPQTSPRYSPPLEIERRETRDRRDHQPGALSPWRSNTGRTT